MRAGHGFAWPGWLVNFPHLRLSRISNILESARAELPGDALACSASIVFSACVLTLLLSIAATQAFLALASVLYFACLLKRTPAIAFPPVKLPLALFCVWTVISVVWATSPAAGGFEIRKLSLFLFLLLTVNLVVSARHLRFLLQGMLLESALAGLVGVDQFVKRYLKVRVQHPHRIYVQMTILRIHGFMGHWMNFGGQQMLMFGMLLAFLLFSTERKPLQHSSGVKAEELKSADAASRFRPATVPRSVRFGVWWIVLGIIAVSIVLNFTRGIWLGCFVAVIYLIARWRARWLWVLPVLLAIFTVVGPKLVRRRIESVQHPSRDPSLAIRLQMWQVGLRMIHKHPLVGVGPDNIPEVYHLYLPPHMVPIVGYHEHLHNDYIQLAAERGLPCLVAWLWFMVALGWGTLKLGRRLRQLRWVAHGAMAGWLALIVEGCFEFNFGTSPVLMVFLFMISTPFAAEVIEQCSHASAETNQNSSS
jgi:O-antigen ligase